jgi:DNA/RNA endonuclease G (NUC1)/V8-like Glu-specific endopeptidase
MVAMNPPFLHFNGVNAATGDYLLPPLPPEEIAKIARGEPIDPKHLAELKWRYQWASQTHLGVKPGVDPTKLTEAGWGVIFAYDAPEAVRAALLPLLQHREAQAGKYYREFSGFAACPQCQAKGSRCGYRINESKNDFLARHGAGPGPADPDKVPYYLLIVGDPESIPFRFQYELDVQYAVGRIAFDTVEEYANYAASVVAAETRPLAIPRKAVFFAPHNPDDDATALSSAELVTPLADSADGVASKLKSGSPTWEVTSVVGTGATKSALSGFLGGANTPALLFTASHGIGFPNGDPLQFRHQGALLCQDWPGPGWAQPIPEAHYFSRDDLASSANPFGLIMFLFACYGGGTPRLDDFAHAAFKETRPALAPHAFLAGLPRRLLGHPKGGALAVVAHVDRAWGYSFHWENAGPQLTVFEAALKQLMEGHPVGAAMEFFNVRYAELSTTLSGELQEIKYGKIPDDYALAGMWTANNDARSYVILGDPAVRVAVPAPGKNPKRRPALSLAEPPVSPPVGTLSLSPAAPPAGPAAPRRVSILSVAAATEQRFRDRASSTSPPVSYSPGTPRVIQANPPDRVRKRLQRLGIPDADIDALLSPGRSFAILPPPKGDAPSGARVGLERILGRNDLIGVEFLAAAVAASRSVGRVLLRTRSGRLLGYGSGAMVSPRLFLTNNHVLDAKSQAESSVVEFGYEYAPGGKLQTPRAFSFAPDEFFLTDPALDFTLVAVQPGDGLADAGWLTLNDDDGAVLQEEYVNIIQHPDGRPKQVALRDNQVTDILLDFLHYRADTEPGSSGAPVFNDQWELIGLHHSGVPKRDTPGQVLARGGAVWTEDMGDAAIDWVANEGVRIGRILTYLKTAALPDAHTPLRDECLAAVVRLPRRTTVPVPSLTEDRFMPTDSSKPEKAAAGAGGITVNIPIHVSVSLNGTDLPAVSVSASAPAPAAPVPPVEAEEAISIDPNYDTRAGYDPAFLGTGAFTVPLPKLPADLLDDTARNRQAGTGDDPHELPYHHYSVVLNAHRRLAFFTAVNIDGRSAKSPKREKDKWFYDPRVAKAEQIGNELYASSPFDRGHLVRRLDPAWGRSEAVVKTANDDTFHFTNCSPQHEDFNQRKNLWAGLEDFLLDKAAAEGRRLTVFTGPVFRPDDPDYRGVRVPKEFWKVAVYAKAGAGLVSAAFLVSQADLIGPVVTEASAAEQVARTFQTTVAEVERLTKLSFGDLRKADVMTRRGMSFAPGETSRVELTDEAKIRVE